MAKTPNLRMSPDNSTNTNSNPQTGSDTANQQPSTVSPKDGWYDIECIIGEKGTRYRVLWKGIDPHTGESWKPGWVKKNEVTDVAVREWKTRKQQKKLRSKRRRGRTSHVIDDEEDQPPTDQSSSNHPRISIADKSLRCSEDNPTQAIPLLLSSSPQSQPLPLCPAIQKNQPGIAVKPPKDFNVASCNSDNYPEVTLDPATQTDSTTAALDDPIQDTQRNVIIPESQDFDRSANFATVVYRSSPPRQLSASQSEGLRFRFLSPEVQVRDTPPPSYQESISHLSNRSRIPQSRQLLETAVQTSPPPPGLFGVEQQELGAQGSPQPEPRPARGPAHHLRKLQSELQSDQAATQETRAKDIQPELQSGQAATQEDEAHNTQEETFAPDLTQDLGLSYQTDNLLPSNQEPFQERLTPTESQEEQDKESLGKEEHSQEVSRPAPSREQHKLYPNQEETGSEVAGGVEKAPLKESSAQTDLGKESEDLVPADEASDEVQPVGAQGLLQESSIENYAPPNNPTQGKEDSETPSQAENIPVKLLPQTPDTKLIQVITGTSAWEKSVKGPLSQPPRIYPEILPQEEFVQHKLPHQIPNTSQEVVHKVSPQENITQDQTHQTFEGRETVQDVKGASRPSSVGVKSHKPQFQGTRLEGWVQITHSTERSLPGPLNPQQSVQRFSDLPLLPNTSSGHTDSRSSLFSIPSQSMSEAPSQSVSQAPPQPLPLRALNLEEEVQASRKRVEELTARRRNYKQPSFATRAASVQSLNAPSKRQIPLPFPPPPAAPIVDARAEQLTEAPTKYSQDSATNASADASIATPCLDKHTQEGHHEKSLGSIQTQSQLLFRPPSFGPAEYVIALPLSTETVQVHGLSQKSVYVNEIVKSQAKIEGYLSNHKNADADMRASLLKLIKHISQIATHPNLAYPAPSSSASDEKEAQFQVTMSAKFRFLKDLFELIKEDDVKIAIVAEAPVLIDLLEVFFRGIKIGHQRLDKLSTRAPLPVDYVEGMVQVFLVPSTSESGAVVSECHVVIAMDSTFDPKLPEVVQIRRNIYHPSKVAPVLRLTAVNTIEHAVLCVPPGADTLYLCVQALKILRNDAGILDPAYEAALRSAPKNVAEWIAKKGEGPLLGVPPLLELPLFDSTQNADKRKRQNSLPDTTSADLKKRKVNEDLASSEAVDITRITSSMPSPLPPQSEDALPLCHPLPPRAEHLPKTPDDLESVETDDNETESEDEQGFATKAIVLEELLLEMPHDELLANLKESAESLKFWMKSASRLQFRYEELRQAMHDVKASMSCSESTINSLRQARDQLRTNNERLATQNKDLSKQLSSALELLRIEKPEIGRLVSENAELKKLLASATTTVEAREREVAFTREQYQTASTATYEIRRELDELHVRNEELQRRADERVIALQKIRNDTVIRDRDAKIAELNMELKEREARIQKLEAREWVVPSKRSVPRRVGSPGHSRPSSPSLAALRRGEA